MSVNLPKEKNALLRQIVGDLKSIPYVKAIVLGGSFATGFATEASDLDVGIYYHEVEPFSIGDVQSVAQKYAYDSVPTVTKFYEWGPWVNGGAWIQTAHGKVDFLYKNIDQIISTIENAKNGIWENHFEQQPPYGFSSIIFLAETQSCIPLNDPSDIIENLKQEVLHYPPKLKQAVIQQSLWAAEFTIWHAEQFAEKRDMYNTVGCLTRAVKNIVMVLFAINELYPIGDKRAIEILEKANITPTFLKQKIETILCADRNTLNKNIDFLKSLWLETVELTGGAYKPFYNL